LTLALAGLIVLVPGRPFAQDEIKRAKIFEETYQLISESDLNCSFYMHEEGKALPDIRIVGGERMNEKSVFSDSDVIYIDKGAADGLEIGQLFLTIGLRAKVEKGCGTVRVGDFLVPFEQDAGEIGKDLGYGDMDPNASRHGKVIYIENDFHIAATGQWALIDMGRQHCVQIGDQFNVFHRARPDLPREAIASGIVIDVRGATSTIKILGARDAVDIGSEVQMNVAR
jgi:hypothetical protein